MGKQVVLTDIEWEWLQEKIREGMINLPASYAAGEQDALGGNINARLAAATTVPDPDPVAEAVPGGVQSDGDFSGEDYEQNSIFGSQTPV